MGFRLLGAPWRLGELGNRTPDCVGSERVRRDGGPLQRPLQGLVSEVTPTCSQGVGTEGSIGRSHVGGAQGMGHAA